MLREEKQNSSVLSERENRYGYLTGNIEKAFNGKETLVRHWTVSAANCYLLKLNCQKCNHIEFCEKGDFFMRLVVRGLILRRGVKTIMSDIPEAKRGQLDKTELGSTIISEE